MRIGLFTFAVVVTKAAFEAISGRVLFDFLYFGMVGEPGTVSHAGGIVGGLIALLILRLTHRPTRKIDGVCGSAQTPANLRS